MIVQITMTRNELFLLKQMLPIWKKYADAFVFLDDCSNDGTYEYLQEKALEYNILKIMRTNRNDDSVAVESDWRQNLYDEALKHSGKIICLDTDEYLDGTMTKEEMESVLDVQENTMYFLPWIQYTGTSHIRVDGKWANHPADRMGSYRSRVVFHNHQMHSEHIPTEGCVKIYTKVPQIFVAHLQWLDKEAVAIKQYYWKVFDYVNRLKFGVETIHPSGYDHSVNNFEWQHIIFPFPLKVRQDIYRTVNQRDTYKYKFIVDSVKEFNIPNLNDWGMGIHPS